LGAILLFSNGQIALTFKKTNSVTTLSRTSMLNDKHLEDSEEANIVDGEDLDVAVAEMAMEHELLHLYHGTTLLARDQVSSSS